MKPSNLTSLSVALHLLFSFSVLSQQLPPARLGTITGVVLDAQQRPLPGANVVILGTTRGIITNSQGQYEFQRLSFGTYKVIASFQGLRSVTRLAIIDEIQQDITLSFLLNENALEMEEVVVTGNFLPTSKLESTAGITTLNYASIEERAARGTGDLLTAIPGSFVDNSAGEVGAQVFTRGLSTGQNNQLGFRYVSLQEEGLPVMSTQLGFGVVDMFHRVDVTTGRLEAIRGGAASVTAANAPGGIFNFISRTGSAESNGTVKFTAGLNANNSGLFRLEAETGGALNSRGWRYHAGGFYRQDAGARTLPFIANQGGQFKFNVSKEWSKGGQIKLYGKILNDRVTFYKHIPVLSLTSGEAYPGFDLQTSSTFPLLSNTIPDSKELMENPSATRTFDSKNGIRAKNYVAGLSLQTTTAKGWKVNEMAKISLIKQDYQQFQNSFIMPTGLAMTIFNPVALFPFASAGPLPELPAAPAPAFPTYYDPQTGDILGRFQGFNAVPGVPNALGNYLYGFGGLAMNNALTDLMNDFSMSKTISNHQFTAGLFTSAASLDALWNVDFIVSRFEPNPRPVQVRFASPYAPLTVYAGSDAQGYVGYNNGGYVNMKGNARTASFYLNDSWKTNDYFTLDAGLRYEFVKHSGHKKGWDVPNESDAIAGGLGLGNGLANNGGLDGNPLTAYDFRFRKDNSVRYNFDHSYQYLNASVGFNYRFRYNTAAVYGRATLGNKAPEMDYYIQNFVNQPIEKGTVEQIKQLEFGYRFDENNLTYSLTGFYSSLQNILFQVFIPSGTSTVFTPPTFNSSRTYGLEFEWVYIPVQKLYLKFTSTLQNARFTKFTYYNSNGTTTPQAPTETQLPLANPLADDFYESFDNNKVNDIPNFHGNFSIGYQLGKLKPYLNWTYVGERYANRRNTVSLPSYSVLNAGISAKFGSVLITAMANNLLNGSGLVSFDGVGVPGGSIEDMAEGGVISQNPTNFGPNLKGVAINSASPSLSVIAPTDLNAMKQQGRPYMVRPILPRLLSLSVSYVF
ncbi:TonB-dependent receptor [Arundinibacter roseus]|uniref:TonB-dependent receptor n=1 Tax=Arundinibacter roseus TaxID=2070510 RepID=A0A4R4K9N2_9BACT|nr:TonB-dependent receptor [Arundinibacter roseus]TDB64448.1 TonB-dependent receptor [Arundinibacter roseus]